jgi:hypothetical protein
MKGAVPLLPVYAFMVLAGTTLPPPPCSLTFYGLNFVAESDVTEDRLLFYWWIICGCLYI